MSFLEKAETHFQAAIAGEMSSIYVEEWDETIYYRESFTISQNAKLLRLQNEGKPDEAMVEAFIAHARDEGGQRLCRPADRIRLLKKVDQSVLQRVVGQMLGESFDDEDAAKN